MDVMTILLMWAVHYLASIHCNVNPLSYVEGNPNSLVHHIKQLETLLI